jgi:hypothetical protein
MNNDDFKAFLELLSLSSGAAVDQGQCYLRLHQKLVGFFSLKGVSDPGASADATIDIAVTKIAAGTPVPDPVKYCKGIARNIAKERLRKEQREVSAFLSFIEDLPPDTDVRVERVYRLLQPCFERLPGEDQKLLIDYCKVAQGRERAEHRRLLAERMDTSVLALRMRVTRLRDKLTRCVDELSKAAPLGM